MEHNNLREGIQIKKSTIKKSVITMVVLLVIGIIYSSFGGSASSSTGNVVDENGVQKIVLSMKNYKYDPEVVYVMAGVPVSISLDDSVYGCFRDLTIKETGDYKYLANSEHELTFTPEKGTYTFACSMDMGSGKIIAE